MTKSEAKPATALVNELFAKSPDGLREIVRAVMQEMLEAEMTDALGAEKSERTAARLGYRSGYYSRTLVTRVGKLELRVPQDRDGRFSTELFERYQRSEQALVATLAEMYVQGVSTRKVKAITEELCGHAFSASAISAINKRLDESLDAFAKRPLAEPFPYLIVDARYEKVREGGVVMSQAVLIAIGIDWDGRRQILAVDMANRESRSSWKDFLVGLRRRGLAGVEFVVADDHAGPPLGRPRSPTRSRLSAVLRPLPPQRLGPSAAQGRRRLPAGIALALRPPLDRGGPPGPRRLDRQVGEPLPEARRLGRGNHRGDAHLLQAAPPAP